jgi:hypothetical protein
MRRFLVLAILGSTALLAACSSFEVDPVPLPENVWYPENNEVIAKGEGNDPESGPFYYVMYYWSDEVKQFRIPADEGEACYNAATIKSPLPRECPPPDTAQVDE